MFNAQQIKDMTGAKKLALFDRLVSIALPGSSDTAVAKIIGCTARNIYRWRETPDKIPIAELLLLQEWARSVQAKPSDLTAIEVFVSKDVLTKLIEDHLKK